MLALLFLVSIWLDHSQPAQSVASTYAALVAYVLAAAAIALAWCIAIELFQLTGLPDRWGAAFWPAMLVLGTVFAPEDLVMYGVGVLLMLALDSGTSALARTPGAGEAGRAARPRDAEERP